MNRGWNSIVCVGCVCSNLTEIDRLSIDREARSAIEIVSNYHSMHLSGRWKRIWSSPSVSVKLRWEIHCNWTMQSPWAVVFRRGRWEIESLVKALGALGHFSYTTMMIARFLMLAMLSRTMDIFGSVNTSNPVSATMNGSSITNCIDNSHDKILWKKYLIIKIHVLR